MKQLLTLLAFLVCSNLVAAPIYNVRDYGAKGDGKTLDSPAINAAIEQAVKDGGGQVLLPAGTYLSGSIRLKSNIDLHLAAGCTILAAPASMKAYDESPLTASTPATSKVCMSTMSFRYERPDYRPAVVLDNVRDCTLRAIDAPTEDGVDKVVKFRSENIKTED